MGASNVPDTKSNTFKVPNTKEKFSCYVTWSPDMTFILTKIESSHPEDYEKAKM